MVIRQNNEDIFNLGSSYLNVTLTTVHHLYSVKSLGRGSQIGMNELTWWYHAALRGQQLLHNGQLYLQCDRLTALCLRLPRWAGTRKVKPIWILLKQERVSDSGISWVIRKLEPRSRQTTMPAPHHSVFYRPDWCPSCRPTNSVKALKAIQLYLQYAYINYSSDLHKAANILTKCLWCWPLANLCNTY